MPAKREILEKLKRNELSAAVERYGLAVADRRVRDLLVEALASSQEVQLAEILSELKSDRLKELCRELGLDDGGRSKAVLIERLAVDPATSAALPTRATPTSVDADPVTRASSGPVVQRLPAVSHQVEEDTTEVTRASSGPVVQRLPAVSHQVEEDTTEGSSLTYRRSNSRVGVYADVANMYLNGGQRMQYDALREFACRDMAEPVRLNAYVTYDLDRAGRDQIYRDGTSSFHSKLRDYGYKVIVKEVRWFRDGSGNRYGKANADLDLAVDTLLQSEKLDRVLIASGDGDFVNVVRALQNRGCRVEAVGLDNTSLDLREEVDLFISGFLIPGLIPITHGGPYRGDWGEIGSRVRGWCYWNEFDRGFGYMRFLKEIGPGLWHTDARHPDSPFDTAYFRNSSLPAGARPQVLPNHNYVFEFELAESDRANGLQATDIELVSRLSGREAPYPASR